MRISEPRGRDDDGREGGMFSSRAPFRPNAAAGRRLGRRNHDAPLSRDRAV